MNLIQDIDDWWAERHGRRREREANKKHNMLLEVCRDLAEEEAKLDELRKFDALCKGFGFYKEIVECAGEVARLKKLIEQHSK
jgi:hypothetical protein